MARVNSDVKGIKSVVDRMDGKVDALVGGSGDVDPRERAAKPRICRLAL